MHARLTRVWASDAGPFDTQCRGLTQTLVRA